MNINFTIFFQIFHFLIAYAFLAKFLFRPLLKLFIQEKEKIVKLNQNIETEQEKLNVKELLAEQKWASCRAYFRANLPQQETTTVTTKLDTTTIEKPSRLNAHETQNMVNDMSSYIKSRILKK